MRIRLFLLLLVSFTCAAVAQVWPLTDTERFSTQAVLLDFAGSEYDTPAEKLFENWGISFRGEDGVRTWAVQLCPGPAPCPPGLDILSNQTSGHNLPLVINSDWPLHRIGFTLVPHNGSWNDPRPVSAKTTVTAFDQYGRLLGSIVKEGTRVFAGLEAVGKEKIARVTIDSEEAVEGIDDLILDYTSRPGFTTYLPQLADGGGVRSSVTFLNLSDSLATVRSRVYVGGGPAKLGGFDPDTLFTLPPRSSRTLVTDGVNSELQAGYALVTSDCPLEVQAVYTTRESGDRVREAGVVGVAPSYRNVGTVVKEPESGVDTAIALVASDLFVRFALIDEIGSTVAERDVLISGHLAKFVSEIFPELEGKDFHGAVRISSRQTLAVLVVRTLHGVATSSFPSGRY